MIWQRYSRTATCICHYTFNYKRHNSKMLTSSKYITKHPLCSQPDRKCQKYQTVDFDLRPQLKHKVHLATGKHESWPKHLGGKPKTFEEANPNSKGRIKLTQASAISSQCQKTLQTPRLVKAQTFTFRRKQLWLEIKMRLP